MTGSPYKRVLLKLSGEALLGDQEYGIDYKACQEIAETLRQISEKGVEIGVVIGGGNIFRGQHATQFGFERTPADHIGILATCINGLALHQVLHGMGVKVRVMSSRNFDGIIEPYNWSQAQFYLEKGVIVIFVGGTGNPYFTTDTAAALRASEMGAEVLLKATKVDGVYDKDPAVHKDAKRFKLLSYEEVLHLDLKVMDAPAVAMCRDNNIEIRVVELFSREALLKAILEKKGGTLICNKAHKKAQKVEA
ncbi:MAG: UMP kinase [Verrucomicrobia bacterium]|nr:UMP kinase [Verrucomicrobiota bacterium]